MRSLNNKVAIVTGASRGIGRATSVELAKNGVNVALIGREQKDLEEAAYQVRSHGQEALVLSADVTQEEELERIVHETLSHWGHVDILVSNAGIYYHSTIFDLTSSIMEESLQVNFLSHVYAVLAVLPHMVKQKHGHIVLVSSMAAKRGVPTDVPYTPAKYALTGFGETIRQELYGTGVEVSTIMPGRVDTGFVDNLKFNWLTPKMPVEWVSKSILRAIRKNEAEVLVIHWQTRVLHYINSFLKEFSPRLADRIASYLNLEGKRVKGNKSETYQEEVYGHDSTA